MGRAGAGAGALLLLLALPCAPVVTYAPTAAYAAFASGPAPPARRVRGGGRGGGGRWCPARGGPRATTFGLPRWPTAAPGGAWATVTRARKLKDTDTVYLHQSAPHRWLPEEDERKRILIIGDVHGCYDELCDLLEKAKFERGRETLILAGDFVNKGPRSADVVKFAREVGAHAVLVSVHVVDLCVGVRVRVCARVWGHWDARSHGLLCKHHVLIPPAQNKTGKSRAPEPARAR